RYVAHVRRDGRRGVWLARLGEAASQGLGVALVKHGHIVVMLDVGEGLLAANDLQLGAGCKRSGLETADDLFIDRLQVIQGTRADRELTGRKGRDDIER